MADHLRGQWIVCVRDISAGEDDYLGPFYSVDKAESVAKRLNRDLAAVGATGIFDAVVEWIQPGLDIEQYRDDMLAALEQQGYTKDH